MKAILLSAILAFSAFASTPVESARTSARAARSAVVELKTKQMAQRTELSLLAAKIESLKAQSKGTLFSQTELDAALKDSQVLSSSLTGLASEVVTLETASETAHAKLVETLSVELNGLRVAFEKQNDPTKRKELISKMRSLRQERESARTLLSPVDAASFAALVSVKGSEDPEELLEQADLLKDNEDKLRRELVVVELRIKTRREEAELDKRMQRFVGEESMFDDQDRRLRVTQTTSNDALNPVAATVPGGKQATEADGFLGTLAGSPQPNNDSRATLPPPVGGRPDSSGLTVRSGSDARPQVGGGISVSTGDDELDDLEVQRLKIKSLAEQLKAKAADFEKRAAQLK
jgi:hypothetical protein